MEFCFVCSRATDHFGEHPALIEAGLAVYDTADGNNYVKKTAAWDDQRALEVAQREYLEYCEMSGSGLV